MSKQGVVILRSAIVCLVATIAWSGLGCVDTTPPWQKQKLRDTGTSETRDATPPTETGSSSEVGAEQIPDAIATWDTGPPLDAGTDEGHDAASVSKTTEGLVAYYGFEEVAGVTVPDLSGNDHAATLVGQYSVGPGETGKAITLLPSDPNVGQGYVVVPPSLLSSASAMTITTWVRLTTNSAWQRVFDFGASSNGPYMFLTINTPYTGGGMRFTIKAGSDGVLTQSTIDGPVLPVGQWKHIAVVLDGKAGRLFVDGLLAASNTQLPLRPVEVGKTVNNWIGRSEFPADPAFDGQVDEFRIYDRALSPTEIAALAVP